MNWKKSLHVIAIISVILTIVGCGGGGSKKSPTAIPEKIAKYPIDINSQLSINFEDIVTTKLDPSEALPTNFTSTLENTLDEIIQKHQYKGISAVVAVSGKGVWKSTRGESGQIDNPLTPNSMFHAASVGKIFTSVVILNLIEEGKLNLETQIVKWFPTCPSANTITIKHLLTHTSGIVSFDNLPESEKLKRQYFSPEETVNLAFKHNLLFAPGTHYSYSNTGFVMLGIIIENILGVSYAKAVENYIIEPLQLSNTAVITKDNRNNIPVIGHHLGQPLIYQQNYAHPHAAGNIMTTPTDLTIFMNALFSGNLLNPNYVTMMLSDMNRCQEKPPAYVGKGIGYTEESRLSTMIGHTGGIVGFGATAFYYPNEKLFISVMINDDIKPVDYSFVMLTKKMLELLSE